MTRSERYKNHTLVSKEIDGAHQVSVLDNDNNLVVKSALFQEIGGAFEDARRSLDHLISQRRR